MNKRFYTFLILAFNFIAVISQSQAPTITFGRLSDYEKSVNEPLHIILTQKESVMENSSVDLCHEDAYIYFINVQPTNVISLYSSQIKINGEPMQSGVNARVAIYRHGTVVMPHSPEYKPLEVYTEKNFKGDSEKYSLHTFHNDLGEMNRKIRSFKLKKGYQATFATSTDGTDYSRIFIADTEDLYVSELPNILDQGISFIRVLIHDWPSKKGWCEVSRPSMLPNANMLECTWLYNWDAYAARSANIEYVPEKWSTSWPGFSTINSSQNVSHLLSYNEPDHVEQSNITVDQAVNQWPELLKTGLRVGSPATTDFSWLYSFMDKCKAKKYRVDYVVIHCYWPSMTAQQWYNDLKAVYDRTGCPIWIKEWNNGANWTTESWPDGWKEAYEKQVNELGPILNVLDTAHFIERYSIYNEVGWKRMVIDDFGKITPAGELYRDNKPTFAYRKESEVLPPTWSAVSPTMSNVTITGDTAICVTWNDRNGGLVDEFIIERNDNSGGFVEIGRVPRTDLQFFDKDALSISGISKYRVKSKMRTGTIYTSGEISSMKSWGDAFFQYGTASTKTKDELFVGYCATMGDNPIAILGVPSYNNGASYPLTARIKEVNNNSLSLAIEPWDYLNVSSLSKDETIGYLSLSAGNHKLGELDAEVSTVSSVYNVWKSVKFDKPFAVVPAVFASISSTRTSVPATVEIKNVTTDGFDVRICPEETTINGVPRQVVSYMAITPGVGSINNNLINVGISEEPFVSTVDKTSSILFNSEFSKPIIFAACQTKNDEFVSSLRYGSLTSKQVKLFKHAETSGTSNPTLEKDVIAWMALESTPTLSSVIEMKNENVEIYPNYVDDYLTISGLDEDSFIRCEIFDLWGRIIMSKTINKNKLDLTNLSTGSYYIKINNEVVKSFIKK